MDYPFTSSSSHGAHSHIPGEEYELSDHVESGPGGGTLPLPTAGSSTATPRRGRRTLTLHANQSNTLLFSSAGSAAVGAGPNSGASSNAPPVSPRRRNSGPFTLRRHRSGSIPLSPDQPLATPRRWNASHFLREDADHQHGPGGHDEYGLGLDEGTEEVHVPDFGHILGFSEDEDHYAIAQGIRTRWKRKLYLLMEDPNSGREAFFIHVIVTGAILFSAVLTTLSTLPSFHTNPTSIQTLFGLDTTLVVIFTIEYFARSLAHSDSLSQYYNWSTSFFPLIDLIAILPYYIEVARQEDTSILFRFSILRTLRLLRVFRAFKYQNQMLLTIEVMYVAVQRSKDALVAISFFILLVLVLFSTLIYFAERGTWDATIGAFVDADGEVSRFDSIPQTAWFALVTMSTVGYGEIVPQSALGKILTVPLLMFGLLLIALPSFVLGRNFAIVFDAMSSQANIAPGATSPRESMTGSPRHESLPIIAEPSQASPLLPTSAPQPPPASAPALKHGTSPAMTSTPMMEGGSASMRGQMPRMWDGGDELPRTAKERDLTNVKLAKNQLVLLEQIDSMRRTIDRQGETLAILASALARDLESKDRERLHQLSRRARSARESRDSQGSREEGALSPTASASARRRRDAEGDEEAGEESGRASEP